MTTKSGATASESEPTTPEMRVERHATTACIEVELAAEAPAGATNRFYEGDVLPGWITPENLEHLRSLGLIAEREVAERGTDEAAQ